MLATSVSYLTSIQELAMCNIEMFSSSPEQATVKASLLLGALGNLKTLRCLDLSKNKMPVQVSLKLIEVLPRLPRLHTLALSQVNLTDDVVYQFC